MPHRTPVLPLRRPAACDLIDIDANEQHDFRHIAADDLHPAALIVALVFIPFTVYNWLTFPPAARVPVTCARGDP
jgi:hypothetical protein